MDKEIVLLIERDEQAQIVHRAALEGAGYRVVEARAGDQAVRMVHQESPSVLVMQCSLPGVSGLRATEVLKEEPELRDLPVVLLGSGDEEDEEDEEGRAHEAGCDAYLTASCSATRLLREVRRLTGSRAAVRGRE